MIDLTFVLNISKYTYSIENAIERDNFKMSITACKSIRGISEDCGLVVGVNDDLDKEYLLELENIPKIKIVKLDKYNDNQFLNNLYAYEELCTHVSTELVCFISPDFMLLKEIDISNIKNSLANKDALFTVGYELTSALPKKYHFRGFPNLECKEYMKKYNVTENNLIPSGAVFMKNDYRTPELLNGCSDVASKIFSDEKVLNFYTNYILSDEEVYSSFFRNFEIINNDSILIYRVFRNLGLVFKKIKKPSHIKKII